MQQHGLKEQTYIKRSLYSPRRWISKSFDGKESYALLWAGSWAARGKITVSDIPNCLNYCKIIVTFL